MDNVFSSVLRIEEEIKKIRGEIKEIKESMRNMATKEDIDRVKNRIDEVEENFRRENRRLRDRISDLEHNYEGIAMGAKVGARIGPKPERLYPPMTFAEDSTICDEYKITTYREKTGL